MTEEAHSEMLRKAAEALSSVAASVRLVGEGRGRFVIADSGDYGIEFYTSEGDFIVDPAFRQELQGERKFKTFDDALAHASDWLLHKP
jgi:hypothetical protein